MKAEESILIERLKKGERTAFNELYGIFWAPLVNYAELIVGDENADDVVQEVFVRIWVGRDKLRILVVGLVIFLLSGIACLFIRNITALILVRSTAPRSTYYGRKTMPRPTGRRQNCKSNSSSAPITTPTKTKLSGIFTHGRSPTNSTQSSKRSRRNAAKYSV